MKKYIFMYDNELVCTRIKDGKETVFSGDKAISILAKKDKINFKKVRIHNNRIVMQGTNTQIIIRDLESMYENGIFDYFYNNISKINKALGKKTKNGVSKGKIVGIATVGIIAAIMLAITAGKIKDRSSEVIEFELEEELEDEENFVQNYVEQIADQPVKDMAMKSEVSFDTTDPNELLNELEEIDEEQALNDYLNSNQVVRLAYDTEYDEVKYNNVYEKYEDYLQVRAPRWGVSPALGRSMLTQESGGYSTNLMQVQFNSWHDQEITLFNYETGKMESIILTNNPDAYKKKPDTQYITEKDLENPKTNISVGCIILQYSFERMHHNIPAAIQCYNFGTTNMNKVLDEASYDLGISVDEILSDPTNVEWLEYRDIIDVGDKNYLEHVLRYITDPEEEVWINYIDDNGEIQQSNITFSNENVSRDL